MQHTHTHMVDCGYDDKVALAQNITRLVELFPEIIKSRDELRPAPQSSRTWKIGRRDTLEMILDVQDDFERLARKSNFDKNDLDVIVKRLLEMQTPAWTEPTDTSHDFKGSLMPRFPSDKWITVEGRYDTKSDANWISMSFLKRAGYHPATDILSFDESVSPSIGGQKRRPLGMIRIVWQSGPKNKQRQTVFLVLENLGFDVVVGKGLVEGYAKVATDYLTQDIKHEIEAEPIKADPFRHRNASSGSHTPEISPQSSSVPFLDNSRLREPENHLRRQSSEHKFRSELAIPGMPTRPAPKHKRSELAGRPINDCKTDPTLL